MKPHPYLKLIISISFYLLLLKFILSVGLYLWILFGGRIKLRSINFLDQKLMEESFAATMIISTFEVILTGLFAYSLYILKKLVEEFEKEKLYTPKQIGGLKLAGSLIITVTILEWLIDFFTRAVEESRLSLGIYFDNLGNPWLLIATGLFFIYLSKVFKNSAELKRKKDLSI
ncbi:DUF2975 domain-containing protein [Gramella sp. BOM4]|nr:DUF2975 domain-containing protein [Christiangramia bathymodioli]